MNTAKYISWLDRLLILSLVFLTLLAYGVPLLSDQNILFSWFTTDDAFYYFKVAENITRGLGSTFDGIAATNGYHPLWMVILIPVFVFTRVNRILPLRLTVLIQLCLAVGTSLVAYQTLKTRTSRVTAFLFSVFWVLYPPILSTTSNGTEAILNAFMLTLFWAKIVRVSPGAPVKEMTARPYLELGWIGVLVLFSRLDNIFLLGMVGVALGVRYLFSGSEHSFGDLLRKLLKIELAYFAPIFASLGVFLIWNRIIFQTWMPISGQVKRYWGTLENTIYGAPVNGVGDFIGEFFSPNSNMGPWSLVTKPLFTFMDSFQVDYYFGTQQISMGLLVLIAGAFVLGYLVRSHRDYLYRTGKEWYLDAFLFGAILQIAYYKLGGYYAPRDWHWVLEYFLIMLFLAIILEIICKTMQEAAPKISPLPLAFVTLLGVGLISRPYFLKLQSGAPGQKPHFYLEKTTWVEERTEPGAVIGMTGSGSTAYFIEDRTVMNIDGLINGKAYLDHLKAENGVDYLAENNVGYLFGNEGILTGSDPYQANYQSLLERSEIVDVFQERLSLWKLAY